MAQTRRMENRRHGSHAGTAREAYYVDGNTVRKVAVPQRRTREEAERRRRESEERERREQRRRNTAAGVRREQRAQRNAAALSIDLPFLALLTIAVALTLAICYNYLCLTASIDARMNNIETLETRLENLKTENDALEQSIDTSVDLNYVYQVATAELGMIHAGRDNMISYDRTESEYVRQNEDIPKN